MLENQTFLRPLFSLDSSVESRLRFGDEFELSSPSILKYSSSSDSTDLLLLPPAETPEIESIRLPFSLLSSDVESRNSLVFLVYKIKEKSIIKHFISGKIDV